jgi:hypothetical protein
MNIVHTLHGTWVEPLEMVTVETNSRGFVRVFDSLGQEYALGQSNGHFTFQAGGALGYHTVNFEPEEGSSYEVGHFRLDARTKIEDQGGLYQRLLQTLYLTIVDEREPRYIRFKDRLYFYFISWLRDHVHVLKAMKYFEARLQDGIDLYRDSQRQDGMIWDNHHRRQPPFPGDDHWAVRFKYGGFFQLFDDCSAEFTRIPVEADVEYLYVEGLYNTWKATGDDAWLAETTASAEKAMDYCISSPFRWSTKYGLIKRGHTIDTWDFQSEEDCLSDFVGWPDPMAVHPEKTRFGIMFGDNTGYAAACDQMAEMLDYLGRPKDAAGYRQRGADIRTRLDELSWNGRFFTHHIPEQEGLLRDLGVDENTQISLSNAYSLNRSIRRDQALAIIHSYQHLKDHLPAGSPGEWYTIYPPFQRGYGGHNAIWQYMNASVTPIVAGELARGAFECGHEAYGVDILRRLDALGKTHGNTFHCSYTGAFPAPEPAQFTPLDLRGYANAGTLHSGAPGVPGWLGEHTADLSELPHGEQTLAGVPFSLIDPSANAHKSCIGLSTASDYLRDVEIPVGRQADSIYFLHTVANCHGAPAGVITLHYQDGSSHHQYVIEGENAAAWNHWTHPTLSHDEHAKRTAEIAWLGFHPRYLHLSLTAYGLDNPYPERTIDKMTLSTSATGSLWMVLGITLSDREVYFRPSPISFGIPNGWGAAAVMYALIEGLAGVVDKSKVFESAQIAPRWAASGVEGAAVAVRYPASQGYAAYNYQYQPSSKSMEIALTGSGSEYHCHILLPEDQNTVRSVTVDGEPVPFEQVMVEASKYVDFSLSGRTVRRVTLAFE